MIRLITIFAFLTISNSGIAQSLQNLSDLKIEEIMKGERFVGYQPTNIHWGEDNETIYFKWNPEMDALRSWYKVPFSGGDPSKLSLEERKTLVENGEYNKERTKKVFVRDGDIYLYDIIKNQQVALTQTVF